jgi:hypothetical protein
VPADVADIIDTVELPCVICKGETLADPRGGLYAVTAGDYRAICDQCAEVLEPEAHDLVRRLREPGPLTATQTSPEANTCAVCSANVPGATDAATHNAWRVVDAINGQPICQDCTPAADRRVRELCRDLNAYVAAVVGAR